MSKRPKQPHDDGAQSPGSSGPPERGLGRRDFVRLVGGAGIAVSSGVLGGATLLATEATGSGKLLGPGPVEITLRVNGQPKKVTLEPRTTLLDALRDRLNITGAKKVCDRGTCGACTVIVGSKAVYSCTILAIDAAVAGNIETIEGLASENSLHPISAAFVDNDAQQCGFCTPGFVMAVRAYLNRHPNPTDEQVNASLGGNLCRCGTYMGVRRAVVDAALRMKGGKT